MRLLAAIAAKMLNSVISKKICSSLDVEVVSEWFFSASCFLLQGSSFTQATNSFQDLSLDSHGILMPSDSN